MWCGSLARYFDLKSIERDDFAQLRCIAFILEIIVL
jgi:hypothetical protein